MQGPHTRICLSRRTTPNRLAKGVPKVYSQCTDSAAVVSAGGYRLTALSTPLPALRYTYGYTGRKFRLGPRYAAGYAARGGEPPEPGC